MGTIGIIISIHLILLFAILLTYISSGGGIQPFGTWMRKIFSKKEKVDPRNPNNARYRIVKKEFPDKTIWDGNEVKPARAPYWYIEEWDNLYTDTNYWSPVSSNTLKQSNNFTSEEDAIACLDKLLLPEIEPIVTVVKEYK
jgi:hypothetical protein